MRKAYLLVYSDKLGSRDQMKECLNQMNEVYTWRFDIPHSFYVISEYSAEDIAKRIIEIRGRGRFVITEISENRQGMANPDTWYLLRNKKLKPK
ncbi:MAG: hypothetical protein N4A71_11035 [Carboxylicivirga sp.]|jgi:hypothetical protein|nr:hypothetical protein [Carboxylicivirga sp.]